MTGKPEAADTPLISTAHLWTPPGPVKGFDCDTPVTPAQAHLLFALGYRFAVRYLARQKPASHDLTHTEAVSLLGSGLGLMAVQHVERGEWAPSREKGYDYGQGAVEHARLCGLPPGTMVWLDLESVRQGTAPSDTIDYCNAWHAQLASAGYLPGVYVGWQCGLDPQQLYRSLRFTHYWGAYNLDADEAPAVRGLQMHQFTEQRAAGLLIDPNTALRDKLGSGVQILTNASPLV